MANYSGPADASAVERVRAWATFRGVQDIRHGYQNSLQEYIEAGVRALQQHSIA